MECLFNVSYLLAKWYHFGGVGKGKAGLEGLIFFIIFAF